MELEATFDWSTLGPSTKFIQWRPDAEPRVTYHCVGPSGDRASSTAHGDGKLPVDPKGNTGLTASIPASSARDHGYPIDDEYAEDASDARHETLLPIPPPESSTKPEPPTTPTSSTVSEPGSNESAKRKRSLTGYDRATRARINPAIPWIGRA